MDINESNSKFGIKYIIFIQLSSGRQFPWTNHYQAIERYSITKEYTT